MAAPICDVFLTKRPIVSPQQKFPEETGGLVDFWGVVRGTEDGRALSGIDYEAHEPMAKHQLEQILAEAAGTFALSNATIAHRIGFVPAGEASLFLRVGSRHRAAAFGASSWVVEELKKRAPIWKRVRYLAAEPEPLAV